MDAETVYVIIGTIIFFVFFWGVILYAFDRRRRGQFDHQAHLPLEDEGGRPNSAVEGRAS